jgi:hypothetical protein
MKEVRYTKNRKDEWVAITEEDIDFEIWGKTKRELEVEVESILKAITTKEKK